MNTYKIISILLFTSCLSFGSEPKDLTKLRNSWNQAKEEAVRKLDKKYSRALLSLMKKYTQSGDLDSALKIRGEIKLIEAGGKVEPLAQVGAVTGNRAWRKLRLGADSTGNRSGRVWSVIPPELEGMSFATYNVRAVNAIKIQVKTPGIIRIAVLDRSKAPLEKGGWVRSGLTLTSTVNGDYHVWEKSFEGDVKLPMPDNEHGYIVLRK